MIETNKPIVEYLELSNVSYQEAWDYQTELHNQLKEEKLKRRKREKSYPSSLFQNHYLIFCEHKPVYTLGKSGSLDHLLLDQQTLEKRGIEYHKINRGGDITYHGPGQLTGYPIFDLDEFFTDVHKYVRFIEEAIILLLKKYGITGDRIEGFTGVWIRSGEKNIPHRKICAIGVHLSRWVTMHGFALNVNTDLAYFNNIIPCGIADKDKVVTSLSQETEKIISMDEVKDELKDIFAQLFGFEYKST